MNANAQNYDTTTHTGRVDYRLQYLDKSRIPSNILYDRVASLSGFNMLTLPDTSTNESIEQAYFEVYNS